MKRTALQTIALASLATTAFAQDKAEEKSPVSFAGEIIYGFGIFNDSDYDEVTASEETDFGIKMTGSKGIFSADLEFDFNTADDSFGDVVPEGSISLEYEGLKLTIGEVDTAVYKFDEADEGVGIGTPGDGTAANFFSKRSYPILHDDLILVQKELIGIKAGYTVKLGETDSVGFGVAYATEENGKSDASSAMALAAADANGNCADGSAAVNNTCLVKTDTAAVSGDKYSKVIGLNADIKMAGAEVALKYGMQFNKASAPIKNIGTTEAGAAAVSDINSISVDADYKGVPGLEVGVDFRLVTEKTNAKFREDADKTDLKEITGNQELETKWQELGFGLKVDSDIMGEGGLGNGQKAYFNTGYRMLNYTAEQDTTDVEAKFSGFYTKLGYKLPLGIGEGDSLDSYIKFEQAKGELDGKFGGVDLTDDQKKNTSNDDGTEITISTTYSYSGVSFELYFINKTFAEKEGNSYTKEGLGGEAQKSSNLLAAEVVYTF